MELQAKHIPSNWHGNFKLGFVYRHNKTLLTESYTQAPWKVQRPFYPEGAEVCHSIILHTAGGIVGGDRLSGNIHLAPNANALITTPAASKIYRTNGFPATQTIQIQVDADACLEWLPQETIVFNGAIYRQDLRVELAPKASWLGWEMTRFGRSARQEKFCLGDWRSRTEVWQQGHPLWIDRQWLKGGAEIINSPHALAGKTVVASLAWIGQPVTQEIIENARNLWFQSERQGEAGVTRLMSGILCRYRGDSTSEVRNWFTDVWQLLRLSYLGRPSCPSRVWQI